LQRESGAKEKAGQRADTRGGQQRAGLAFGENDDYEHGARGDIDDGVAEFAVETRRLFRHAPLPAAPRRKRAPDVWVEALRRRYVCLAGRCVPLLNLARPLAYRATANMGSIRNAAS
jgi:hypothetical protein